MQIVSTTDIYRTLLELCNAKVNHSIDGTSMLNLLQDPADAEWRNTAYSYFRNGISVRTDKYRMTKYFRDEAPEIELYNHEVDRNETINIAADNPEIVDQLMPVLEKGNNGLFIE